MSFFKPILLDPEFIAKIKEISPGKKYGCTSPLFYEGHVPVVAYLLIDGSIILLKNKKIKSVLKPGHMIGLNELMSNTPSKLSAQVAADSTLCFLDKSTVLELSELMAPHFIIPKTEGNS